MTKFPSLKCPICGKTYKEVGTFGIHMRNEHPGTIPDGWSDLRYAYFIHTGKSRGHCRECGGDTPWNETTGAYSKICTSEVCRKKFRDRFMASMRNRYGKTNLLDDPKYRERMLTGRKISGEYTFHDGGKIGYMGKLEKAFLVMLDQFFRFPSSDILSPSPNRYTYYYENPNDEEHNGTHIYVPDFFIPSCNLEIELKSSDNQRPRNLLVDVVKDACKDVSMIRNPMVNFVKIYEDDYYVFFQIFADLANQNQTGEKRPIKYISRSLLTSIYRDYIPDDCLKIIDQYIYKYSEKSVMKKAKATESAIADSIDDPDLLPILEDIIAHDEIDEEEAQEFSPETVYRDTADDDSDENTTDTDDSTSGEVGVNPMMYYKLGEFAEPTTTAAESFDFFSIDEEPMQSAMEWWSDNIDTSKIDGRAAMKYGKWRDRLFGNKLLGGGVAKAFSKVTIENGNIVIRGINCNLLLYRIKEKYSEAKLKYIFEYKYNDRSYKLYMKKKIGRGDMKIDYVYAPQFFCLELVELFNELGDHYRDASYKRIAEMIYEASWLSKSDNVVMPPLSTEPLQNLRLELMPHQIKFIESWPQLKNQLNTNGYVLAFKPGKGKTLTAIGLAECLKAKKVYIVCPNNLKDNWALEIKKYYAKYDDDKVWMHDVCILGTKYGDPETARFIITNNENIKLMLPVVSQDPDTMFILDECHNFRNFNGGRSKELFALCDKIGSRNVLCVSATPIKASPAEITPVLRIIDPTFNDDAAEMYAHCFDLSNTMAMSLVTKRFGKIIYRPPDVAVDLPPKNTKNLELQINDESRYYLDVVHDEIVTDFKKRHDEWLKGVKPIIDDFQKSIYRYAMCDRRMCNGYINWVITSSNSLRGGDNHDFHEVAIKEYKEFIDTYIRPNSSCPSTEVERLITIQNEFITAAKRNMGKAVGSILPKRRSEMFIKLYEENKTQVIDIIRNRTKKTIIFSTMVPVVKYIAKDLSDFGIGTVTISGDTKDRLNVLTKFREDPNTLVLVATSWCMGVGVTLTEASQMFFFGPPWRSTDFEQASDRIWRIGQTDPVDIFTIVMKSKKQNLSNRMQDILAWSSKMFDTAITAAEIDDTPDPNAPQIANEMYGSDDIYAIILSLNRTLNGFKYGIVKNGVFIENPDPIDVDRYYTTLSPGKFIKYRGGICFDYMAYQDFYLRAHGLVPESYFIRVPAINQTHTFTVIEDGDRWIYLESAFYKIQGVYTAKTLDEIVNFIVNTMLAGRTIKPTIEVTRVQSYYGRYDETPDQLFARIEKQGTKIRIKYSPYVKELTQIVNEEDAIESFNMNSDDDQYELLDKNQMRVLSEYKFVADWVRENSNTPIYNQFEAPWKYGVQRSDHQVINSINKPMSDWETIRYLYENLAKYEPMVLLMEIDGVCRCDHPIYHPIFVVPFSEGALYMEFAFSRKRNGIYYVTNINNLISASANWFIRDTDSEGKYIKSNRESVRVRAWRVPLDKIDLSKLDRWTYPMLNDFIMTNGDLLNIKYNSYETQLHRVEVLNHGWSIDRW